jgi:hypothetical protein
MWGKLQAKNEAAKEKIFDASGPVNCWGMSGYLIEYYSTSHSSTERSIPPIFTKCLISFLSCSSEYCFAFSIKSKTFSTPLACNSSTFALTTLIRSKYVFLTAGEMYDEEIRKESFPELDLNCFLRKPIANQDLIERLKDILNNNINP